MHAYFAVIFLLGGCVLDRTGQSATEAWRREMAIQSTRTSTIQSAVSDAMARVEQLEEVTRARGQDEIFRMETVDQLRNEVARLRGDLEVLEHQSGLAADRKGRFLDDAEYRISWLETRARSLEESLGMEMPPPPARPELEAGLPVGEDGQADVQDALEAIEEGATAADLNALARSHLGEERHALAEAVAKRALDLAQGAEEEAQARFLIGEALYGKGSYAPAILAFQEVLDRGAGDLAPEAMLRQWQCFAAMGQEDNAAVFFDDLIRTHPKSRAAREARQLRGR